MSDMSHSSALLEFLERVKALETLPGETEEQFRQRIAETAQAIQGTLDTGARSVIAEPQTFDEISTPGSTPQTDRYTAAERENFKRLHAEAEAITDAKNRKLLMAGIAGLALAATVATGGAPSLGAIAGFAAKGISALLAHLSGGTAEDAPAEA